MHDHHSGFIGGLAITGVWNALGGPRLHGRRGIAWWRNGTHLSVSVDPARNLWYDHPTGSGGGNVALVQTVLQCDRAAAIGWLCDYAGVPRPQRTPQERRDYARRRAAAEAEADALIRWRDGLAATVRDYRDLCLRLYHVCVRRITGGHYAGDDELAELMDTADRSETEYLRCDDTLDCWQATSWEEVLVLFRQSRGAA